MATSHEGLSSSSKYCPPTRSRTHPLYKKLSSLNGEINRLSCDEVRKKLRELDLSDKSVIMNDMM